MHSSSSHTSEIGVTGGEVQVVLKSLYCRIFFTLCIWLDPEPTKLLGHPMCGVKQINSSCKVLFQVTFELGEGTGNILNRWRNNQKRYLIDILDLVLWILVRGWVRVCGGAGGLTSRVGQPRQGCRCLHYLRNRQDHNTLNPLQNFSNSILFYVIIRTLDQGHLHPKLEVPGLTCPGRESKPAVGGEHSRKEPFKQLVKSNS